MPLDLTPWVIQGGAVGLLGWTVWLILTGRLVPRRTLDKEVAAEQRRAADALVAARLAEARAEEYRQQVDILLGGRRDGLVAQDNGRAAGDGRRRGTRPPGGTARGGKAGNGKGQASGSGTGRSAR